MTAAEQQDDLPPDPESFGSVLARADAAMRARFANLGACPKCQAPERCAPGEAMCWDCDKRARRAKERDEQLARLDGSIPARWRWASFGSPLLRERVGAAAVARGEAAVRRTGNVVLVGPAGVGKTSLAVAMLRAWSDARDQLALFASSVRLSGTAKDMTLREELVTAPLVLLDDMGAEAPMATNLVPRLLQLRHENDLPTWVTTWLTTEKLAARYGDGIARRVLERAAIVEVGA